MRREKDYGIWFYIFAFCTIVAATFCCFYFAHKYSQEVSEQIVEKSERSVSSILQDNDAKVLTWAVAATTEWVKSQAGDVIESKDKPKEAQNIWAENWWGFVMPEPETNNLLLK